MVWKSNKINQVYLLLYQMSQSGLRIISQSPENCLSVFSEFCLRVVIEWPQSLLTVVSETPQSFLRAFSVPSQKLFQSHLRDILNFLPLSWIEIQQNKLKLNFSYFGIFDILSFYKPLNEIWKNENGEFFALFQKYYESFQFWFIV
jgi:hypothetical protein